MSSAGQTIGAIGGAVAGFFIAGPVGALKGAAYGAAIGGYIDPPPGPNLRGPTLEDKSFQSAAYGVSIPRLYGTIATMGNIIYLENNEYKAVSKKESQGGKGGGGGTYETTTYFATFAVALAESMPGSAIRRLWAGGKLIYSAGTDDLGTILQSQQSAAGWKYYDGAQTEPDARMEAVLGVGNCPSYEGTAYIIFYDFELTEYGNGLTGCPVKAEVTQYSENGSSELAPVLLYESSYPYAKTRVDPATGAPRVNNGYVSSVGAGGKYATFFTRYSVESASIVDEIDSEIFQHTAPGDWRRSLSEPYDPDDQKNQYIVPGVNDRRLAPYLFSKLPIDVDPDDNEVPEYGRQYQAAHGAVAALGDGSNLNGLLMPGNSSESAYAGVAVRGDADAYLITDEAIVRRRFGVELVEVPNAFPSGMEYKIWYQDNYLFRLSVVSGGLRLYIYDGQTLSFVRTYFYPEVDIGVDWQFTVYAGVLWLGMARHEFQGSVRTEFVVKAWSIPLLSGRVNKYAESVAAIIADLCGRVGIPSSELLLTEISGERVDGYRCSTGGSARADIGPLLVHSRFDLIERGYGLYAKKRGGEAVVEVPWGELIGQPKRSFTDVTLLPSRYSINYIDYNREYDTSVQSATHPAEREGERTESVPIVMSATAAAQLADILIAAVHTESIKMDLQLPQLYLSVHCGDVVDVEFSRGLRAQLRVDSITKNADQTVSVTGAFTSRTAYTSAAVGAGVDIPPEIIPAPSIVSPLLLDIPMLRPEMNTYGMVGLVYTGVVTQAFKGAVLQKSSDNGQNFSSLARYSGVGTVAVVEDIFNYEDCFVIDRSSVIDANVLCGQFYSVSENVMMTGKNYVAYGAPGRWEIMRFSSAVMVGNGRCIFSTLLRGLSGTEWAASAHQQNDFIVLLDDPDNQFLSMEAQAVRAVAKYRAVSVGSSVDDSAIYEYRYEAVNLKPLSVVNIRSVVAGDVVTIAWDSRTRAASSQWVTGMPAPIGEANRTYEIDVKSLAGVVVKTYRVEGEESFSYSEAQQAQDTNLSDPIYLDIYQISALVGRGYKASFVASRYEDEPFWSNVQLLLNFNGPDGSVYFPDSSKYARPVSAFGDARVSSAHFKYGDGAARFDGVGDYLQIAYDQGFDVSGGDFTLESWIFLENTSTYRQILNRRDAGVILFAFAVSDAQKLVFAANSIRSSAANVPLNQWAHVACCLKEGVLYMSINGVVENFGPYSMIADAPRDAFIGVNPSSFNEFWVGWLDDLRLTKGVARYVENFTPPVRQLSKYTQ